MSLDVKQALDEYNITYKEIPNNQIQLLCPFHDDTNPSGLFFLETRSFYCHVCHAKSSFYGYLSKKLSKPRRSIFIELSKKFSIDKSSPLDPAPIHRWHEAIWKNELLLKELHDRQISDDIIEQYQLGAFADDIISIPITTEHNKYVNVRKYRPGAKEHKFANLRRPKKDQARLFPIDQITFDRIVVCGGECKALALIERLNPYEIGAISPTTSEGVWELWWNGYFEGKIVYVCSDIDLAGVKSAEKRCKALKNSCENLYKITLPLDIEQFPTGDVNDFLAEGGNFLELIEEAEEWTLETKSVDITEPPVEVDLNGAVSAEVTGKRVSLSAVVSSLDTAPYPIPKKVEVECDRGNQDFCVTCNIYMNCKEDEQYGELSPESIEIIEMVSEELRKQDRIFKRAFGIPNRCMECQFYPKEFYNVEDCRVSQELNISNRDNTRSMQIAYCIGDGLQLNEHYSMEGRQYPHPKHQQAALLISNYEVTDDALTTYKPVDLDRLKIFQPEGDQIEDLQSKLNTIYADLEANVTKTFDRREMHLMFDLAYHSPLFIDVNKDRIKGWVEVLIVGDSGMAKSQAIENLSEFYRLGEIVSCKNATVPGLMGGLQQSGKRWFAEWGKFVTHDRRLVILEEFKGVAPEVFAALTNMRTSGVAEITKIEKRRAYARTRLIVISNPKSDRVLSEYNYGIDAIKELIKAPEDLRRFDAALILEKSEVDVDECSQREVEIEHIHTSDLCRELILFAWTRERVKFRNPKYIFECTKRLCEKFDDVAQIVYRATMKDKLARLSAALATRLFSIEDEDTIVVEDVHIEYITRFLDSCYSRDAFGYDEFSNQLRLAEQIVNRKAVIHHIKETKYPDEFVDALLRTNWIDHQLFQDIQDWDPATARKMLSFLFRQHALRKEGKLYRKTKGFTGLLKDLSQNGQLTEQKPKYLEEKDPDEQF